MIDFAAFSDELIKIAEEKPRKRDLLKHFAQNALAATAGYGAGVGAAYGGRELLKKTKLRRKFKNMSFPKKMKLLAPVMAVMGAAGSATMAGTIKGPTSLAKKQALEDAKRRGERKST